MPSIKKRQHGHAISINKKNTPAAHAFLNRTLGIHTTGQRTKTLLLRAS